MKIAFITGTRADYGLIKPVIDEALAREGLEVQLIVTGSHLSKKHGYTIKEIIKDGIKVSAKIKMLSNDDSAKSVTKSMGKELLGLAEALDKLNPDLVIIPGDRYEMLAAASACLVARIPVAHLYGGDVTEGAFDDSIRHAITKMSALHFTSNDYARKRVIQMGERPENVFNTGSPALDKLKTFIPLSREELEESLKIEFRTTNILVTFHPETLADTGVELQMDELCSALQEQTDSTIIITMPNADPEGQKIREIWQEFAKGKENVYLYDSLGYQRYFSLLSHVSMVLGNSSSGLYEAPSFKIPTINIGNRQQGRLMAESVISVPCGKDEITSAIQKAKSLDCSSAKNPYSSGDASKKIIDIITKTKLTTAKKFHDIYNS